MKYGVMGGFIKFAFAKTAFDYIEKEIPELDMPPYKQRALKAYRTIVERTPGIGSMKDNMFVMTVYAAAFVIALQDGGRKNGPGKTERPDPRGGLLPADGEGQAGKERLYRKGDRRPHQAVPVVPGSHPGIPHELVLLL